MTISTPVPSRGLTEEQAAARQKIYDMPLDELNPGDPGSFETQEMWWKFERLREQDPVHFTSEEYSDHGNYWSLSK